MQNKRNTGGSKALRVLTVIIGALMILVGMLSASGDMDKILEGIGVGGGLLSFAKTMEKLPVWNNTTLALVGLLLIGGVLNGIDVKKRDNAALNSKLIRRPVQRLYLVFLAPTFAAFCLGFLYPFVKGIFLSFCRFKTTSKWTWVGFDNYVSAFNDPSFLHAFWYTAIFAVTSLILINVLSFAVAYALTRGIRGTNIFRTVFFMPNLIGGIVLGYIWQILLNGILANFGKTLTYSGTCGFWGLVILMNWQQIGYMMIIYIAGIQNIPGELIEAAKIDGATNRQLLRHVTIPMVMPSITICTFLTLTNSFKLFDQNLALTAGEPSNSSQMLALNIYETFYTRTGWEGAGQAKAVVFFIIVAVIAMLQNRLTRSKEVQQ